MNKRDTIFCTPWYLCLPSCDVKSNLKIPAPFNNCKIIDAIITNFHLPKSTLLALIAAFAGLEEVHKAYKHAVENKYRFYSYGDAMLII